MGRRKTKMSRCKRLLCTILVVMGVSVCFSNMKAYASQDVGYSLVPTEEEMKTWESDGTLQQRKDFMEEIEKGYTAENIIARWNQKNLLSNSPEVWQGGMPTEGDVKALVFMVEFQDMKNTDDTMTPDHVQNLLFSGQNPEGLYYPYESLTAYYQRSSYGKLNISGDVYGWYTLAEDRSAYENDWEGREKLIKELLDAYDEQIDFSDYDSDGDGNVDALYIYYAGGDTGYGTQWWSYMTKVNTDISYDGSDICGYVFFNDLYNCVTVIHETGHLLGLPDYYNSAGLNSEVEKGGVGYFDMMDHNLGDHNIFSKLLLGWVEPYIITESSQVTLELLSSSEAKAVIVAKEDITSIFEEYYILELYNNSGNNIPITKPASAPHLPVTDKPLVKIYHVDANLNDEGTDFRYDNNSTEHKLIKLLESDGEEASGLVSCEIIGEKYYKEGMSLGPNTLPSSDWYGGVYSGIDISITDITENSATVNISTNVADTQPPKFQDKSYELSTEVFDLMPVKANAIRVLFDTYIYRGENFANVTITNAQSGQQLVVNYDILNPRPKYADTINRYNMVEMKITSEMSYDTEYIVSFPANSIKDASGNGNNAISFSFKTAPQMKAYSVTNELNLNVLPDNAPSGVNLVPGYQKDAFYMDNGNVVVSYSIEVGHTGIVVLNANKEVLTNTYLEPNVTHGTLHKLGDVHYVLAGSYGYAVLHQDGTVLKSGSYRDSGYDSVVDSVITRDDCIDIRLYSLEYANTLYICRINTSTDVNYLYPNIDGSDLNQYNKDYTYRSRPLPNQYEEFLKQNHVYETFINYNNLKVEGDLSGYSLYRNIFHIGSSMDWINIWDSSSSVEKCDNRNRKHTELNTGYGFEMQGFTNAIYVGDGYVLINEVNSVVNSPTLQDTNSCITGYSMHAEGSQITRLDEDFNVLWTTFIPVDENHNCPGSPIRIGDTLYIQSGKDLLKIDDATGTLMFASQKEYTISNAIGTINEEKQTIVVNPGTTIQAIANSVQGQYNSIAFYNTDYELISDWSKVIHNGMMKIESNNGFYSYYYQITDIKDISLNMSSLELNRYYSENIPYNFTSCDSVPSEEDNTFLYVVSTDAAIAEGVIVPSFGRGVSVNTRDVGEATLTVYNVFGDATAECSVKVYPEDTIITTGVEFAESQCAVNIGDTMQLIANVLPVNATDQSLTWSSSDESIVAVNAEGEITAISIGEVTITATTSNGKKATCTVLVKEAVARYSLSCSLTTFGDETDAIDITICDANGAEMDTMSTNGLSSECSFDDIAEGNYVIKISKENHVTREFEITVSGQNISLDAEIHLLGDVDGNDRINARDKKTIYNHIAGENELTGYDFQVGDVNGDGKINARDKKVIYNHILGESLLW